LVLAAIPYTDNFTKEFYPEIMNLKLFATCCFAAVFLFSCGSKQGALKEYIRNADSASIAFYINDSTTHIIIKDKESIEKLGGYIDGEPMQPKKCKDSGSIWFYEGGKKKMQIDFSINPECSFFTYMMNDKIFAKQMSEDATQYLNSVKDIATDTF
jgi:hypothetical protein